MYQALYRKWRPRTFSQVIGQEHITGTLQHQVAEGRTAHAYLFTGTRGTGKTTCARILAKAVNCLQPVDGAPCNACEACRGIDNGSLLDVTELDAASNSRVDDVRELLSESVYTPTVLKKRVYIIDEVHMLSTQAFNALLKTIEEPPEHLLFILATTELHKVPATILSRCQRFSFKRILPRDIEQRLLYVAGEEGIDLAPDGAEILARMANGALRDGLSLLDQCRVAQGTLDSRAVLEILGLAGSVQTIALMRSVLQRDVAAALGQLDELYRGGKDVAALLGELGDLARDMTILKAAPEGAAALLTGVYDSRTLAELAQGQTMRRFLYMNQTLQSVCSALADSLQPRTDAELCLLRLCDESLSGDLTALCQRMDRLEEQLAAGVPVQPAAPRAAAPEPRPARAPRPAPTEAPPPPPVKEEAPPPPAAAPKAAPPVSDGNWAEIKERCKARLPVNQRVYLNMAQGTLADGCLTLTCGSDFIRTSLDNAAVLEVLREESGASRIVLTCGTGTPAAQKAPAPASRPARPKKTPPEPQREQPPLPQEAPPPPEQTPPWEEPPATTDRLDELIAPGSELEGFRIK